MPKFLGVSIPKPGPGQTHPELAEPSIPASSLSPARSLGTISKESAGKFFNRAGVTSKESAGSFRNRAAGDSKESVGSGFKRPGFSSKESAGSFRNRASVRQGSTKDSIASSGGSFSARSTSRDGGFSDESGSGLRTSTRSKERPEYGRSAERSDHGSGSGGRRRKSGSGGRRSRSVGARGSTVSLSGFRKSTGRSPSEVSGGSGSDFDFAQESSSDSQDLDDADAVPEDLKNSVPFYIRMNRDDVRIVGKNERIPEPAAKVMTRFLGRASFAERMMQHASRIWHGDRDEPDVAVVCGRTWAFLQIIVTSLWVLTVATLLVIHVWRTQEVRAKTHDFIADVSMRVLEVNVSSLVDPAVEMLKALAIASKTGLLDLEDKYDALKVLLVPLMQSAPSIRHVQVLGLIPGRLARVIPGLMHEAKAGFSGEPVIFAVPAIACSSSLDPLACFGLVSIGLDTKDVVMRSAGYDLADSAWEGPSFLTQGLIGEPLEEKNWVLAHHLLGRINRSGLPNLFFDIAVDVRPFFQCAAAAAPVGGELAISTLKGLLLASSTGFFDGRPILRYPEGTVDETEDPEDGAEIKLPDATPDFLRLTDISSDLASALSPKVLSATKRSSFKADGSLAVVRPLYFGTGDETGHTLTSAASLRVAVLVPAEEATRLVLVIVEYTSLCVLASPFATALTLAVLYCSSLTALKFCRWYWRSGQKRSPGINSAR